MKTRAVIAVIVGVVAGLAVRAPATVYYVHSGITGADNSLGSMTGADAAAVVNAITPSDSNPGTDPSLPFLTLAKAQAAMTSGDTLNIAGRFYDTGSNYWTLTDKSNITIRQWFGQAPAAIYGFRKPGGTDVNSSGVIDAGEDTDGSHTAWASAGSGCFTKTLVSGLLTTPVAVAFDYDLAANIDASGRHKAFLAPAGHSAWSSRAFDDSGAAAVTAVAAAATATRGAWDYNSTSRLMTIKLPNGADPAAKAANGVAIVSSARVAFRIAASGTTEGLNPGYTLEDLSFLGFCDSVTASPAGSPVAGAGCDRLLVRRCVFEDCGLHALSLGSGCTNNVTASNVYRGCGKNCSFVVFNAGGPTGVDTNTVRGCRCYGDVAYANTMLDHAGIPVDPGPVTGFYAHGNAATNYITDAEFRDCRVIGYIPAAGTPDSTVPFSADNCAAPADAADPFTYPYRVRQTDPLIRTVTNGVTQGSQGVTKYIAWINCRLDYTTLYALPGFDIVWGEDAGGSVGCHFFDGCEFVADFRNNTGQDYSCFVSLGAAFTVRARNSAFYDMAAAHADAHPYHVFRTAATPNGTTGLGVFASQCVMGFRTGDGGTRAFKVIKDNGAVASSFFHFNDNTYLNVGAATWSDNTGYDSTAEWTANVDATPFLTATNPFADPTGASLRLAGAAAWRRKDIGAATATMAGHSRLGSNGQAYARNYGPWQSPSRWGRGRGRNRQRGE